MTHHLTTDLASPLGLLTLVSDGAALIGARLATQRGPREAARAGEDAVLARAREQLAEYFAGSRTAFDLPLAPRGTPFEREVWRALTAIPFGETTCYSTLAARLGRPGAARAVGAANGKNPIAIVIPCHRVVGARGALVGYAGGLDAKAWLLGHESREARLIA